MGTKYTYDGTTTTSSASFTTLELTGSTLANYAYVEEDPYLRVLRVSGANAVLNDITIASGGTLFASGKATVNNLVFSGTTANVSANFTSVNGLGGAVVSGLTIRGGAKVTGWGAKFYDIDIQGSNNSNLLAVVSDTWANAYISGGTVSQALVNMFNGAIDNVTFYGATYINLMGSASAGKWTGGGTISGGTATLGASIRIRPQGARVSGMVFDSNAVLELYGDTVAGSGHRGSALNVTFKNGAHFENGLTSSWTSDGSKVSSTFEGGFASNCHFISGGYMNVRSSGTVRLADFSEKSYATVSNGGILTSATLTGSSYITVSNGGKASVVDLSSAAYAIVRDGGVLSNVTMDSGSWIAVSTGGALDNVTVQSKSNIIASTGATITNVTGGVGSGQVTLRGGNVTNVTMSANGLVTQSGGTLTNATGRNTATFNISSGLCENLVAVGDSNTGATINTVRAYNGAVLSNAYLERTMASLNSGAVIKDCVFGSTTWINLYAGAVISGGTGINGAALRASAGTYIGTTVMSGAALNVSSGLASDCIVGNKGSLVASSAGTVRGTVVEAGGTLDVRSGATVSNTTIHSGGIMYVQSGNNTPAQSMTLEGVTVQSGGSLVIYTSNTGVTGLVGEAGATIKLNVYNTTADTPAAIDSLANVAELTFSNNALGTTYNLAETGNPELRVKDSYLKFTTYASAGQEYINPLYKGRKYTVNAEGTTYLSEEYTVSDTILTTEAADLATSGAVVNGGDKALLWRDVSLAAGSAVTFANAAITGDAWLDLDGAQMATGATLYGAAGNYGGTIRYLFHGDGKLANFAAGAEAGGKVGSVELVSYNNDYGLTYVGGFGDVTGHVSAVLDGGNTLSKDFYAGALANYKNTGTRTSVGNISLTVDRTTADGVSTVKGNLYGASAVKAGTISTVASDDALHTVGDVSVTLRGTATKSDFSCFAGGYATGTDSTKLAAVYTVDSVTVSVENGTWGEAHGGRGIFGGIMASGVAGAAGDVNITISGGTMGNVYGGGWAQKGGTSTVGDVNITITGGTIANVFGGGSTSTSGGSTVAGNVTITVSGGTINGDIYARGQGTTDSVASANVVFTGSKNFACNVWGYSYVGGSDPSAATLTFDAYTGKFSGDIGGFAGIEFTGNTVMTLNTQSAKVANDAWIFDLADRGLWYDSKAILSWATAVGFQEDTITLKLPAATRSDAWTLVTGASAAAYNTAAGKFLVEVDGGEAIALTYDSATGKTDAIASGEYAGWGFAVEDSVLKFKKLA